MRSSATEAMRVLIADDQKSVATSLAALVAHCQHEVVEIVGSGLEAIQAFDQHKPDLVLMDYCMARLNGATACRNILAKDPAARVILISAWSPNLALSDFCPSPSIFSTLKMHSTTPRKCFPSSAAASGAQRTCAT